MHRNGNRTPAPLPGSCDGVGWQNSQSLNRRGRRVLDTLLSFGGCLQVHWYFREHFELSIFLLSVSPQSVGWRYLGERAYLRVTGSASSLWTPLPTGLSATGAGKVHGTRSSLRK